MKPSAHEAWAQLRFSIIGPLLSSPVRPRMLGHAITELSRRQWLHPVSQLPIYFAFATIERWYYKARNAANPVTELRKSVRKDFGRNRSTSTPIFEALHAQYRAHPHWSFKLHFDNLAVLTQSQPALGKMPSYSSLCRLMKCRGLRRTPRNKKFNLTGTGRQSATPAQREVRSYEVTHVGALWHLDFHISSHVSIVCTNGERLKPVLFAVLDDCCRVCCHAQWYLIEEARTLADGLLQAFLKHGLPREILMDNGGAMLSSEVKSGLLALGIVQSHTLPYCAYQNGKQEHFWAVVEGRLMAMLDQQPSLTLYELNHLTQAWIEGDYHKSVHAELGCTPRESYLRTEAKLRPAPDVDAVRKAFMQRITRTVRQSDGTFSLGGIRFEVPQRFRHFRKIIIRYAHWDLSRAWLVDERLGTLLAQVQPIDRSRNANGLRRVIEAPEEPEPIAASADLPPLLRKLIAEYSATGVPRAFLTDSQERN